MTPSLDSIQAACSLLGIDNQGKTATELELLYWKVMCQHLTAHIEQLQAAYERVLLGNHETVAEWSQYEADVAFLTDQFLSNNPIDLLQFTRTSQRQSV